ncbi:ABC transporter substrate-binding protein [Paenibacillus sp. TRM 82003]|uniref:siderophore ABC transporter substrate-binding protein n=1 Tax=Kineococcus sp. TRM81007 TaxID=2925831 RepID=UPI001F581BF0|nr:ABC transporter substrate-binding protein [Kineococcus sp. TRM81007]MCI2239032.1 ABC transporter substrate-binding protein [Kineococcus sp. TRM81007]MCI3924452.1 ABC transporter substrate-binding protein [Paenibacillus sp. TRM 82003]
MNHLLPRRTAAGLALGLAACLGLASCSSDAEADTDTGAAGTRTVQTNTGAVEIPAEPVRVAALDNTSFATLKAFGITPVAVPKPLLPAEGFAEWASDESIADAGSHREPVLEAISEADPDLIIGGYRFAEQTEELSKIAPTVDVSPSADAEGGFVESLKAQTTTLGEIFGEEERAAELVAALEEAQENAAAETDGESVFLAVASGGHIDNGSERLGSITEPLGLTNVLEAEGDSIHNDSGLAPETIAQLNPDWMVVLDRDAAIGTEGASPAKQLVSEQEAWKDTTFVSQDQIVYLPPTFYVTEGIQAYTEVYDMITDAFAAA